MLRILVIVALVLAAYTALLQGGAIDGIGGMTSGTVAAVLAPVALLLGVFLVTE